MMTREGQGLPGMTAYAPGSQSSFLDLISYPFMQNTLTGVIERHVQRVMNTHSDFVKLSRVLHNATG